MSFKSKALCLNFQKGSYYLHFFLDIQHEGLLDLVVLLVAPLVLVFLNNVD